MRCQPVSLVVKSKKHTIRTIEHFPCPRKLQNTSRKSRIISMKDRDQLTSQRTERRVALPLLETSFFGTLVLVLTVPMGREDCKIQNAE